MEIMLYAIPVFFLLIGVELLVGLFSKQQLYRLNDAVTNISCGVTQQITGVFIKLIGLTLYIFLYELTPLRIPNHWATYILLFILIDMLYYWFHRYSHEINTLWGAHVVHHQSEDYNLSVALRQSAFQGIFSGFFYLPLALMGFDPVPFAVINILQTLYQFWIHTEAIRKMPPWFEYLFNTPSHHRVHHGRNPQYIDRNHGGTLIIFDRLFGTFEPEGEAVVYGVTKPLASWNPLWANFDYYKDLLTESSRMPRLADKLYLWVASPGWRPASMGGPLKVPAVDRESQEKYQRLIPKGFSVYVLLQYIVILRGTTGYLIVAEKVLLWQSLLLMSIVLWAVGNLGGLMDKKAWGLWSEYLRLISLPILLFVIFGGHWAIAAIAGFALVSLFGLLSFHKKLRA